MRERISLKKVRHYCLLESCDCREDIKREIIEEGVNGSVDLSKYYQKSWTGAPFTNQEWGAEVGKGHSYANGVDGNNPEGNQLLHPRA